MEKVNRAYINTHESRHIATILGWCCVILGGHNGGPYFSTADTLADTGFTGMDCLPVGVHSRRRGHGRFVSTLLAEEIVQEGIAGSIRATKCGMIRMSSIQSCSDA